MSKVSQQIKAQRAQHRADHYTDNDRALKGMGQQERRQTKFEAYGNQGAQSAGDFNFDQYGKGHISGQEIKSMQSQGFSQADIRSAVAANGGEVGKRAQKKMDKPEMTERAGAKETAQSYRTGANTNTQKVDSSINKNINQDNDINSSINGDNNYSYNRQDNSVRTYGGDTRVFNYQSSGNPALDSPASAATMGGYWDVDDSPAARAKRLDQNVTMANDYAKDNMDTGWIAQGAIKGAEQGSYINPSALDNRIRAREKASFAQSKVNDANLWGDPDQYNWSKPEDPEKVEMPDFEGIGKSYTDF